MISLNSSLRIGNLITNCRSLLNSYRQNVPIACSYAGAARSLEERLGMPPKPKKPLTPYFRYMQEMRPILIKENPKARLPEIIKIMATKWETVDEATKAKLQEAFKKDQITYVEKRAKYDSKITDDQRKDLKKLRHEMTAAKERRSIKKRIKELGRPKKPASAFLKFIISERATSHVDKQSYKDWHKKVCEKWIRLSEEEKEKLKAECRKEMEVYKQEISKWEEKMVRLGNIDVVRQEAMIDPASKPKPKLRSKTAATSKTE